MIGGTLYAPVSIRRRTNTANQHSFMWPWTHLERLGSVRWGSREQNWPPQNLPSKFQLQLTGPMRFDRSQKRNKVSRKRHLLNPGTAVPSTGSYSCTGQHSPSKMCVFYHQILQTSRLDRRASRLYKTRRKSQRYPKIARFGVLRGPGTCARNKAIGLR